MVAAKLQLSAEEWKKIEALAARARVIGGWWMKISGGGLLSGRFPFALSR